jgi:hypothetical protein
MALRTILALVPCVFLVGLPACDKQTEAKRETSGDAGAARPPGVDKNLAEAVAAVAGGGAAEASGPPPNGVFAAGAADKEMKASDPPKFTLGGKGSAPTVQFGASAAKTGKALLARTEVAVRLGPQQGLPTMDLSFTIDPEKPAAPQDDAAKDQAPGPKALTAKVVAARLAKEQPGTLPPELAEAVGRFKGSKLKLEASPLGGARIAAVETAKGAEESFELVLQAAGDALVMAYLPYPAEPVGAGAYWLVTTREPYAGLDVIAYRMVKLDKVEGDRATLTVNTKRYVAGGQLAVLGLPQHQLVEFAGSSNGQLIVAASEPANLQGLMQDQLGANIHVPGQPPGRDKMGFQLQMKTQVTVQSK